MATKERIDSRAMKTAWRSLIAGAVTLILLVHSGVSHAQGLQTHVPPNVAAGPKGPLVFLDYDQIELDFAYTNNALWAPNRDEVFQRRAQRSAIVLDRLGEPRRYRYGDTDIEALDLYATPEVNAPIHIFVHGGGWRSGKASSYAYLAEQFVDAGAHFVAIDFASIADTDGSLVPLAQQVRRAIAWVYEQARSFGGNPDRLYLSGHSAGAHLAAVALTTDWERDFQLPADTIKGAVLVSGMYDLYPVSLSRRNDYVEFDDDVLNDLSPIRHIDKLVAPVIVAYGSAETPEFKRQAVAFVKNLEAQGVTVNLVVGEGLNHFEMSLDMSNPYGVVGRRVLGQMGLRSH